MKCKIHHDKEAIGKCSICGEYFCKDCLKMVHDQLYCLDHVQAAMLKYNEPFSEVKDKYQSRYNDPRNNYQRNNDPRNNYGTNNTYTNKQHKNKRDKKGLLPILIVSIIIITVIFGAGIYKTYRSSKYIDYVKTSTIHGYDENLGDRLGSFFDNPKWNYDQDYSSPVVTFTGDYLYNHKLVPVNITFYFDGENDSFSILSFDIDYMTQTDEEIGYRLECIMAGDYDNFYTKDDYEYDDHKYDDYDDDDYDENYDDDDYYYYEFSPEHDNQLFDESKESTTFLSGESLGDF